MLAKRGRLRKLSTASSETVVASGLAVTRFDYSRDRCKFSRRGYKPDVPLFIFNHLRTVLM